MTMAELVIGMAVFAITSAAAVSGLLHSRRLTESSLRQNTAQITAHGYLEQLKGINFALLDTTPVKLRFGNGDLLDDNIVLSPLPRDPETARPNVRRLDVNNTPADEDDDLVLTLVVYVEPVTESSNGSGPARAISIQYEWNEFSAAGLRTRRASVSCIRSDML